MKVFYFLSIFFILIGVYAQDNLAEDLISKNEKNTHTDVVIISHKSKIIFEKYQNEYDFNKPHLSWSMAKTISGILIAIASEEYGFSLEDSVRQFIPEFSGSARIVDLLQMSSGIDFTEDYYGLPVSADVVKMLYLDGVQNGASGYVKSLPQRKANYPGDHFYYSSGDTNLLMEILFRVINNKEKYLNYPWVKFFDLLEIKSATFELDKNDFFIGSSYIYLSPEDYLKVADLLVHKGVWKRKKIIPEKYFELMTTIAPGVQKKAIEGASPYRAYSAQVTTNLAITEKKTNSEYADLPSDSLLLIGHQGQLLVASPSQELIILRLAMDKGNSLDRNHFFKNIKVLLKSKNISIKTASDHVNFESPAQIGVDEVPRKLRLMDLFKVPQLIRRYTAKEFCSCYFVSGRSRSSCEKDISVSMPLLPKITVGKTQITTTFVWGADDSATYRGKKYGCVLN